MKRSTVRQIGTHAAQKAAGIECPSCGCKHLRVLYTRGSIGGRILRRRECRHCGRRFTTYEKAQG